MSDFVDECRQEWKRLGVPDTAARVGLVLAEERPRRTRVLAVLAALAVVAIAGAALLARASRSVGLIGSVRKVVPAPFVGPRAGIRFPLFATRGPGSDLTHGIGVLLLLAAVVGLIAATIYWSRRARPNH